MEPSEHSISFAAYQQAQIDRAYAEICEDLATFGGNVEQIWAYAMRVVEEPSSVIGVGNLYYDVFLHVLYEVLPRVGIPPNFVNTLRIYQLQLLQLRELRSDPSAVPPAGKEPAAALPAAAVPEKPKEPIFLPHTGRKFRKYKR